ncbi:hypothetical protein J7T55_009666 [Diaporthe amygdali]|uniref:uncharacterized protein n=1 Tax=Phomopsis amygdali TaxID=1214568 RepID=UPI0022FE2097|nr:uncharacterized protein J7T55_009666 [Diaporthe amygdali]KAJ0104002.1 hypothetical protein J7T55_009666 [Diaporthe amygdali]
MSDAAVLSRVSGGAIDGRLGYLRVRQRLFLSFHSALIKHRGAFLEAAKFDDGCSTAEAQIVFASALIELRNHYDLLNFQQDLELEYSLVKKKSNENRRKPIALTYIIPNSFNLLYNFVSALSAALEAGSCVIVELDYTISKTAALLGHIIDKSLDRDAFGAVSSRAPIEVLSQCLIVDQNALNQNNISAQRVLLSPAYRNIALVDRTSDIKLAAKEIVASRLMFGGGSSYAVDLVLVNEFVSREFKEAVSQELTGVVGRGFPGDQPRAKSRATIAKDTGSTLLDQQVKNGEAAFVGGEYSRGILQILDRHGQFLFNPPLEVIFSKVTSLDDAIDFLSTEAQTSAPVGGLYLFSAHREAKYLSQYIDSQVTYVNHIPAQLSVIKKYPVGPMAPKDYPTSLRTRYTREMFELPSPEVVPGPRSHLISSLLDKADSFDQVAQKPLKPTDQLPSGAWGFFEQGIILGAIVYILPTVGLMTYGLGYVGWIGYGRVWR